MPHISKIQKVLEALGYKETDLITFKLKRFEKLNKTNVNIQAKDANELDEKYKLFTERYELRIIDDAFPAVSGRMELKEFIEFLREYDEKFNLNWCEIDFKEFTIKPAYL
jgi:hypothetical protein